MQFKTVLFDLDGTLLPMEQERFLKAYFGGLTRHLAPYGYEPEELIKSLWMGTAAMVKNDGSATNETVFWKTFEARFGPRVRDDMQHFDAFYRDHFDTVSASCGNAPEARRVIDGLHRKGIQTVLATNPLFPSIATEKRMGWVGLSPADFTLFTTYENSRHCKPNPDYYRDILQEVGAEPADCLMVGNDVEEDMIAETLGMKVFLLTDCLINKHGIDIDRYPHGGFADLIRFLDI